MNFIRHTFIIALTFFVFVGSVGVGIYSHFCSKDGVEQSYFIQQDHHCEKQEIQKPSCCQHKEITTAERDCCSDEMQFMKIDLDYFQQVTNFAFVAFAIPSPVYNCISFKPLTAKITKALFANPPPILSGKDIIIHHQVFLI